MVVAKDPKIAPELRPPVSAERSRRMALIRSTDTKPELIVRKLAHSLGYRFRLHRRDLPGKPDLVFPRHNAIIFVHGCFWHGHDCPKGRRRPKSNVQYWESKITGNANRDRRSTQALLALGWSVLIVWECETSLKHRDSLRARLHRFLGGGPQSKGPDLSALGSKGR